LSNVRYDTVDRARDFDAVRDRRQDALDVWLRRVAEYLPPGAADVVADIGSGTGIWSRALADRLGAQVYAVEPSTGMRGWAAEAHPHPAVTYLAGNAYHLPLQDESLAGAWLSTVIHQFADMPAAARELRRVLRPGAPVLIRGGYPGRQDEIELFHRFPGAMRVAEQWPRLGHVISSFEGAGFVVHAFERVREPAFDSYDEFLALLPLMRCSDTALVDLDDDEWLKGVAAIEGALAAGETPWALGQDLLVLR
jgi:ubiquinone/menaquinone biosynthesis C-methylase UbiE